MKQASRCQKWWRNLLFKCRDSKVSIWAVLTFFPSWLAVISKKKKQRIIKYNLVPYVIGLNLTALLMTFEGSISLITRSKRLRLPETVADILHLLPLVLKLVFNAVQIVKGTMNTTKEASTSVCLDNDNVLPLFSPCYLSSNKRKAPEDD